MFSYLHHIGDFNKATRHLTRIERSVYRDMIEIYYETEKPLPHDIPKICRLIIANNKEERAAVIQVLAEFFHITDAGYAQLRCEHEIEKFSGFIGGKSKAGKVSAERRAAKRAEILGRRATDVEQVLNTCTTGVELRTNTEATDGQLTSKPVNQLTSKPVNQSKDIAQQVAQQDKPAKKQYAARLPNDWKPTQDHWDAAILINSDLGPRLNLIAETFRDYWIAKSGKDAAKMDWMATWKNWIRREAQNAKGGTGTTGKKSYGEQRAELFDGLTDYAKATNF